MKKNKAKKGLGKGFQEIKGDNTGGKLPGVPMKKDARVTRSIRFDPQDLADAEFEGLDVSEICRRALAAALVEVSTVRTFGTKKIKIKGE